MLGKHQFHARRGILWLTLVAISLVLVSNVGPVQSGPGDVRDRPPSRFRFGPKIQATKVVVKPGSLDPYELLEKAAALAKSHTTPEQPACLGYNLAILSVSRLQIQTGDRAGARVTLKEAETVARTLDDETARPRRLAEVAMMASAAGDAPGALRMLHDASAAIRKLPAPTDNMQIETHAGLMIELAQSYASIDDTSSALAMLKEAFSLLRTIGNDVPGKASSLCYLAMLQTKYGDSKAAFDTAREFDNFNAEDREGLKDDVFQEISLVQANSGNPEAALKTALLISQDTRLYALSVVTKSFAKAGRIAQALEVAEQIPAGHSIQDFALLGVVEAQAGAGDFAGALVTTDMIYAELASVEAHLAIARAQFVQMKAVASREHLRNAALTVPALIKPNSAGVAEVYDVITKLASLQLTSQDKEGAHRTLQSAAAEVDKVQRVEPCRVLYALIRLFNAQIETGDPDGARRTIQMALNKAQAWDGSVPANVRANPEKCEALVSIARAQAKLGESDRARDSFQTAVDAVAQIPKRHGPLYNAMALANIAQAQAEVGDRTGALKLADSTRAMLVREKLNSWATSRACSALAAIRVTSGDDAGAEALLQEMGPAELRGNQNQEHLALAIRGLTRHGRNKVLLDLAGRSDSIYIYLVMAGELFRMHGVDVDVPNETGNQLLFWHE